MKHTTWARKRPQYVRDALGRAEIVRLDPADVLLVGNLGKMPKEELGNIRDLLAAMVPGHKILVFHDPIDLKVLRKAYYDTVLAEEAPADGGCAHFRTDEVESTSYEDLDRGVRTFVRACRDCAWSSAQYEKPAPDRAGEP